LSKVQAPPPRFQISIRQWSLLAGIASPNATAAVIITPHSTPIRNMRLILFLMSRRLVLYCHGASARFCCATQELYFAPSFARVLFLHCPFTKDRSSPANRFLAPATDGRSFDVQALNAQLWLNFRLLGKTFRLIQIAPAVLAPRSRLFAPRNFTPVRLCSKQAPASTNTPRMSSPVAKRLPVPEFARRWRY
jgi:hypothetical protein